MTCEQTGPVLQRLPFTYSGGGPPVQVLIDLEARRLLALQESLPMPLDGREGVAARPQVHDAERDLLVDWRRDRIPESGSEQKGRQIR